MSYDETQKQAMVGPEAGRTLMDHRPPSCTEKLKAERTELAKRVAEIDAVLIKLEANPKMAEIIDDLSILGRGMF